MSTTSPSQYYEDTDGAGELCIWVKGDRSGIPLIRQRDVGLDHWHDIVAHMTGTTITNDDATVAAIGRVGEFLRQWQLARNKGDLIYGVHHDIDADMADLTVSDLTAVLAALTGVPHA